MTFRILRYFYDTRKEESDQVTVNPTNLTTCNENDAIEICGLLKKAYALADTKTHHSWYSFGYEVDDPKRPFQVKDST